MHICAEPTTRIESSRQLPDAPLPNGRLGTTYEFLPQHNELGSVRHGCELQGEMTSYAAHGLSDAEKGST